MLARLFPKTIDNNYRGSVVAIFILVPIVLLKLVMGLNVAGLNPLIESRDILIGADGVPLDSFGPEAASTVVFMFKSWGLGLFILSLFGLVVLVRYRAMIPLLYLFVAAEQIGRKAISMTSPIIRPESAEHSFGFYLNWGLSAALLIGFILALVPSKRESR